jgi:anti-sigma B factor antagonist
MSLKITERLVGEVTVLDLDGRITVGEGTPRLRDYIRRLVSQNKIKIVVNCAGVKYVDSSGNGEMVSSYTTVRNSGGVLRCCNLQRQYHDILTIQRFDAILAPFETEAEAIRSLELGGFHCKCPGCGSLTRAEQSERSRWRPLRCQNCGAVSTITLTDKPLVASVQSLRFGTYLYEECSVVAGRPMVIQVVGRLDIFSSPALRKSWNAVPPASEVLFELSQLTEVDGVGLDTLTSLVKIGEETNRAVVLLEGLSSEILSLFPAGPPFYLRRVDALEALGSSSEMKENVWTTKCAC